MQLLVNGKAVDLPDSSTIADLLEQLEIPHGRLAVEVNTSIVPRSQHASTVLKQDDAVEIVHAIGGG